MKAFEWSNPATLDEAVKLLAVPGGADAPDANPDEFPRPMAGGQDLLTSMKDYIQRPSRVVNLKMIPGMGNIEADGKGGLKIGALTTLAQLAEHDGIARSFPAIAEAARSIATPQIRNLGTIGGNLCQRPRCWYFRMESVICLKKGGSVCYAKEGENKYHAIFGGGPSYIVHPSDLAPVLAALDATLSLTGPDGKRQVPVAKFFTLPRGSNLQQETVLKVGEIVSEIAVPASAMGVRSTYLKFKERSSLDFAMAAVAAAVELAPDKTVAQARIVLGGVAPIPWRVPAAEKVLIGKPLTDATIAEAAKAALAGAVPMSQNAYKIPLTQTLVRRALAKAAAM